ncbi:MAG: conjugal transfer protein TraF, partial [Colwellia sp.]|nr:conjugal transfer protein TraF [Colwellia sp.]
MLKKKYLTVAILASVASMSFYAQSGTHSFDARSTGMGGIGVSSADYLTAAFHNPALVAKFNEDDDVGLLLPYIGAQAQDPEELVDQLDDFSDLYDKYDESDNPIYLPKIIESLEEMQGDTTYLQAGVGGSIAIPNTVLSVSVYTKAYADGFIVADIHDNDLNYLSYVDPNYDLQSQAVGLGVSIVEAGVAMAKSFKFDTDTLYIGVTPKYQNVTTINYVVSVDDYDFDDVDDDRYQTDESNVNVDIGVAYAMGENFVFGFVGKNLIEQSYDTVSNANIQATYVVNPVYT